ncbi:hypothetical protein MP228_004934 [Amoeboaphelidium protococcarum]|nr:hypothetical protein MP228_004934 [Amoeboaphelidium protococcarum]
MRFILSRLRYSTQLNAQQQNGKVIAQKSACSEGTVMTGLNIFTGQQDPVAMKDEDYPEYLWTLLDQKPIEELPIKVQIKKLRKAHIKEVNSQSSKK